MLSVKKGATKKKNNVFFFHHLFLTIILPILLTFTFYPQREGAVAIDIGSGRLIERTERVYILGLFSKGFTISPKLDKYAAKTSSGLVALGKSGYAEPTFAWDYWLLFVLIPWFLIDFTSFYFIKKMSQKKAIANR